MTNYYFIQQYISQNSVIYCRILSNLLQFVLFCNNILVVFYVKSLYNILQKINTLNEKERNMERILTFCKKIIDETGQEHLLYYWLLKKKAKGTEDDIYGIEITKYRQEQLIEKEQIESLSTSESRVVELIQKMARGNVTPMTLLPLADDFLSA